MKKYYLTVFLMVNMVSLSLAQLPLSYDIRSQMDFYNSNKMIGG